MSSFDDSGLVNPMKHLFSLTGTTPGAPERIIGVTVLGLTVLLLAGSGSVLLWALRLLR